MKEKTFEELAREEVVEVMGFNVLTENQALKLMQQVREATIAECRDIALQDDIIIVGDITTRIEKLPTDRIKLTEK